MRFWTLLPAMIVALPVLAEEPEHLFTLGAVEVLHPWAPATSAAQGFVYLEMHNEGAQDVTLLGADSAASGAISIVGFTASGGTTQVVALSDLVIAADSHLEMEPNVLALQLLDLSAPLVEGGHFDLTLQTSLGPLPLEVEVEAADATQHGHAGHSH